VAIWTKPVGQRRPRNTQHLVKNVPIPRQNTQLRRDAAAIWQAGVDAVAPGLLMRRAVRIEGQRLLVGPNALPLAKVARIRVVGAGKAAAGMTAGLLDALGPAVCEQKHLSGIVNALDEDAADGPRVKLHAARPAGDPFPCERGAEGSRRMLELVSTCDGRDLVLCLLSGGGSALMPCPVQEVSLAQKREITALLGAAGATIGQLNAVRKHLSRIKGGRLGEACRAGRLISLIISDVVGNPLDVIASGPTTPDPTTFAEALGVLERSGLLAKAPDRVVQHLRRGAAGDVAETPKSLPESCSNVIIGDNATALAAAAARARRLGYNVLDLGGQLEGESWDVGVMLADLCRRIVETGEPCATPACVVSGGETVVSNVASGGKGGRNQEIALAAACRLGEGVGPDVQDRALVLSGGTDGEDGPTDAAGAFVDRGVLDAVRRLGLEPADYRARSRSYDFFDQAAGLVKTGPTGTNVMDLRVALVR